MDNSGGGEPAATAVERKTGFASRPIVPEIARRRGREPSARDFSADA